MPIAILRRRHRFAVNRHQLRRWRSQSWGGALPPLVLSSAVMVRQPESLILLTLGVLSGPNQSEARGPGYRFGTGLETACRQRCSASR
jgi:hypothetical protein